MADLRSRVALEDERANVVVDREPGDGRPERLLLADSDRDLRPPFVRRSAMGDARFGKATATGGYMANGDGRRRRPWHTGARRMATGDEEGHGTRVGTWIYIDIKMNTHNIHLYIYNIYMSMYTYTYDGLFVRACDMCVYVRMCV